MRYLDHKEVKFWLENITGVLLCLFAGLHINYIDTTNYITIGWDVILIFIVIGFGFSLISLKKNE